MSLEHKCSFEDCSKAAISCFQVIDYGHSIISLVDYKFSCLEHEKELLAGLKDKYARYAYTYTIVDVAKD